MNTIYRKGDTVYHYSQGNIKGTVLNTSCIRLNNVTPIAVQFQNGNYMYFKNDGSLLDDIMPSLSFTPYTLEQVGFSQERPKPEIEKGQVIYFKGYRDLFWMVTNVVEITDGIPCVQYKDDKQFLLIPSLFEYSIDNPLKESI